MFLGEKSVENRGKLWVIEDSNLRPPACKAGALTN